MPELPERMWLPLSGAADLVRKKCECSIDDARQALVAALRDGQIYALGTRPNPVYKLALARFNDDEGIEKAFPPLVAQYLNPKLFYLHNIDWQTNTVGEVSDAEVNRTSLLQWLGGDDAARPELSSTHPEPEPALAPVSMSDDERKCEELITERAENAKAREAFPIRDELYAEIEAKIPGLPRKAFERAWVAKAPEEWKNPGPKKRRGRAS